MGEISRNTLQTSVSVEAETEFPNTPALPVASTDMFTLSTARGNELVLSNVFGVLLSEAGIHRPSKTSPGGRLSSVKARPRSILLVGLAPSLIVRGIRFPGVCGEESANFLFPGPWCDPPGVVLVVVTPDTPCFILGKVCYSYPIVFCIVLFWW